MEKADISSPSIQGDEVFPWAKRRFSAPALGVLGFATLVIFVACMVWPARSGFWGPGATLAIAWLLFAVHLVASGRSLTAFDPLIWIPVIMLLHYFGMPLAVEVVGAPGLETYDAWGLGRVPHLGQGFAVALLSFSGLLFGAHLAGIAPLQGRPCPRSDDERSILGPGMCLLVGGLLMILVGIPLAGTDVITADYLEYKTAEKFATADLRLFGTGFLFATAGIYAVIASHTTHRPIYTVFALFSMLPVATLLVLTGDRTGLSVLALAGGWAFTQRVRPAKRWYVILGFVLALVVMPIIKEFRETRSVEAAPRRSLGALASYTVYEMGSSVQVFCYSLEYIPSQKPYDWGVSFVSQFVNQIPNLGLSPGAYFGLNRLEHDPSVWVTNTANPTKFFFQAGGYGYAMGAEWYFNFGIPGVMIGMTFCGWLLGWARNSSRRSPMRLTFAALLIGMYAIFVRNDFGYPLRTMLWPMIGLLILRAGWPRRRRVPRLVVDEPAADRTDRDSRPESVY